MKATLLVVDDDPTMLEVGKLVLEHNGYKVVIADGAESALAAFGDGSAVDAVLADVRMPGMRGPELLARMREIRPEARLGIVTGSVSNGAATEPFPTLYKPFPIDKLLKFVRDLLA